MQSVYARVLSACPLLGGLFSRSFRVSFIRGFTVVQCVQSIVLINSGIEVHACPLSIIVHDI